MQVRLVKMHTHEGRDWNSGEVIDLVPELAGWLIDSGVAEPFEAAKENHRTGGIDT